MVWGIGGDSDTKENLQGFAAQMGLTYPILYDDNHAVQSALFSLELAIHSVYPSDWLVGIHGELIYVNNEFDTEELLPIIEAELAKMNNADDSD